ncbi:uncharacterized protein [Rhodnius prolixus]|uniref:uncharacterized protein n=1 Tax=Rhodnius prolixus TaxID=13249 RepID=UPI003D18FC55
MHLSAIVALRGGATITPLGNSGNSDWKATEVKRKQAARRLIKKRMEKYRNTTTGIYECDCCNQTYARFISLYRHMEYECTVTASNHTCPYCPYTSFFKRKFVAHVAKTHQKYLNDD